MTEPPDIEALARRYLDLWQQHLAEAAGDPVLAAAMARLAGLPAAPGMPAPSADADSDAGRPQASRPASRGRGGGHDELARRVAALEERLDALERTLGGGGRGARERLGARRR